MASVNINPQSSIIWVDSDTNVSRSTSLLTRRGWGVSCFNETADALNALRERRIDPLKINCVITSMMERGGRRERGLLNGLQMLDEMKVI
jgi:DNA-binding NtrC family response regulator